MNTVSDHLFMVSLAVLVMGVMTSGFAFNPFPYFAKARRLLETRDATEPVVDKPEEKPRLRKIPLILMLTGLAGILASIGISYV